MRAEEWPWNTSMSRMFALPISGEVRRVSHAGHRKPRSIRCTPAELATDRSVDQFAKDVCVPGMASCFLDEVTEDPSQVDGL